MQARNGEWWLGTGAGLYRFPATDDFARLERARPLAVYTTKDGLTSSQVFRLFEDSRGGIWVSTIAQPSGLARWERAGETWHDLSSAPGLHSPQDDLARAFGEDSAGNVWLGFNAGASPTSAERDAAIRAGEEGGDGEGVPHLHRVPVALRAAVGNPCAPVQPCADGRAISDAEN